ncbi:hypothetical protein CCB80_11175 [Armatimonadetes bacterium Uphvl-Ar1]|nr:hypothetical protein CCB80_11175 [Armatimonadetes bacterium Uphvl-Ar1]
MNSLKTILVAASLLVSVFAFAQAEHGNHTAGKGVAKNQEQTAEFEFRAGQVRNGEVKGNFSMTVGGQNLPSRVKIELKRIGNLEVGEDRASFQGAGVLVVNRNGRLERVEGRIKVTVFDVTGPNENGEERPHRDRIKVEFKAANSNLTFDFEGFVTRGDIRV